MVIRRTHSSGARRSAVAPVLGSGGMSSRTRRLQVPQAVAAKDVDVDEVKTALTETIEALAHPESNESFEELLGERLWCEARLSAVRKSEE